MSDSSLIQILAETRAEVERLRAVQAELVAVTEKAIVVLNTPIERLLGTPKTLITLDSELRAALAKAKPTPELPKYLRDIRRTLESKNDPNPS